MTCVTRRYPFSASHRLHSDRLTAAENERLFGKCNHPFGHGHNYYLEVTVVGEIDPRTGVVVPPAALDREVERAVLSRLDHRDLNADVPEFTSVVPTTENLGLQIGRWLAESWPQVGTAGRLARVRLEETGSNTIEIRFPGDRGPTGPDSQEAKIPCAGAAADPAAPGPGAREAWPPGDPTDSATRDRPALTRSRPICSGT